MSPRLRTAVLLFVLAFGVRAAFVALEPRTRRVDDEPVWIVLGQELAAAGFSPLRDAQVFHPPLYPYVLGGLSAAFGGLEAVKWAQAPVGALLAPLLFLLGARAYGPRVGTLAGGLAALYPELVWYCAHFWSEILFVTLLWWGFERLLASEGGSRTAAATAGLAFGLAVLTRETILLFAPLGALWLVLGKDAGRRRAAAFVLATFAVVAPWTARNFAVTGAFVPVATRGSFNLWLANTTRSWAEVYREHQATLGGPIAQERHARREALTAIFDRQPRWIFEKAARELPAFWGVNDQIVVHLERRAYKRLPVALNRTIALLTVVPYLLVLGLGLLGLASTKADRASLLLVGFLLFYLALHVVAFAAPRFRLPVLPVLFLLGAQALERGLARSWSALDVGRKALAAALAVALGAAVVVTAVETLRDPAFSFAQDEGPTG